MLADAGQGETPLVPHPLQLLSCEKSNAHQPDPIVELTAAAFKYEVRGRECVCRV